MIEIEPKIALEVFGGALGKIRLFARNLEQDGERLGLIGPLELPRLWTRHLVNCALLAPFLGSSSSEQLGSNGLVEGKICDVGSGAGLPGLVLAAIRTDLQVVLIEPMERRAEWLKVQVQELELTNVEINRNRAEEVSRGSFSKVTARAVGSLTKLIPLCAPLLVPAGELLFMKGSRVHEEIAAAEKVLRKWHIHEFEVLDLGAEYGTETTKLFRARVD